MYYCTALSAVFDWICALQVFIIIIIIANILLQLISLIINEPSPLYEQRMLAVASLIINERWALYL